MEHDKDWNGRVASRIGSRISAYRKQGRDGRPMTAQALADRCAALGAPMDRAVIAKLEKGLRQTVTVAELLVIAKALGVPPVALIFSPAHEEQAEVLPGRTVPAWSALRWFTGVTPLTNEAGDAVSREDVADFNADRAGIETYRWHDVYIIDWRGDRKAAARARELAEQAETEPERLALLREADARDQLAAMREAPLYDVRSRLRDLGMILPELPAELAHIDSPDYQPVRRGFLIDEDGD